MADEIARIGPVDRRTRRRHIPWLNRFTIAPRFALERDDRGNVAMGEVFSPCLHGRLFLSVKNDIDVPERRSHHDLAARERRKGIRYAFTVFTVAAGTIFLIDETASGNEVRFIHDAFGGALGRVVVGRW